MNTVKICTQCGAEFGSDQRFCPNDGTPLRPTGSDDALIGQVIADRYQITRLLGEGGMGRVYLSEHVRMGRKSAVKVMSPNLALSGEAISRFNREASNASRINHPNVAQIYDFGETSDGMLYLAMEFIEGDTLRELIARDGPMPAPRAADITKQICEALAAAHHLGIVHRDLKPDNVMIARHHDGRDWVKVVDFGIAKTVQGSGEGGGSQTVTTAGVSLGTPEYMSPEQLAGERLDSRTDLYSLGLVLFNMLTGDLPYPRVTSKETLVRRLTSRPRSLKDVAPDGNWPTALQNALDRALAQDPKDRYSAVVDFGREVVAACAELRDADRTVRLASVRPMRLSEPTQRVVPPTPMSVRKLEPVKPNRRSLVVAGVVLVIGALAAGAFVANRARSSSTSRSASPIDTAIASNRAAQDSIVHTVAPETASVPTKQQAATGATVVGVASASPATQGSGAPNAPPPTPPASSTPVPRPPAPVAKVDSTKPAADTGHTLVMPTNATDADRFKLAVEEVHGHLARAGQYLSSADVPKLRGELRDAQTDLAMLRQIYPQASDSARLEQQVRQAAMQLFRTCPSVVADTSKHFPPNFKCEQLIGGYGRGRQGQAGFTRRPPKPF